MDINNLHIINESAVLRVENPIYDGLGGPIQEAAIADFKVKDVQAVYPLINALNSEKITRNSTYYPRQELIGKKNKSNPTGYSSWVLPYAKPVIEEHRLSDGWNPASSPLGRVLMSSYKPHEASKIIPAKGGMPGYEKGDGAMQFVCCISDQTAVPKVLGGAFHTVSIGANAEGLIESISGQDLIQLRRQGKELPPYSRGQRYNVGNKEQLSYWTYKGIRGAEVSYVNSPSDTDAYTQDSDIGIDNVRMLLGQKKIGENTFEFCDALTLENVLEMSSSEYYAIAPDAEFIESQKRPKQWNIAFSGEKEAEKADVTESTKEPITENTIVVDKDNNSFKVVKVLNSEYILGRQLIGNKESLNIKKLEQKNITKTGEAIQLSITDNLTEKEKTELKEYFKKKSDPNSEILKNSPFSIPLLALHNKESWDNVDLNWAWSFKQVMENCLDSNTLQLWGIGLGISKESLEKINATIDKVQK
jgi:hypothetical protein